MGHIYYDLSTARGSERRYNYRFIEPPIIIYYVNTVDEHGNVNIAPVSLGTHMGFCDLGGVRVGLFSFSMVHGNTGRGDDVYTAWTTTPRDTTYNLDINKECVISYATQSQVAQMRVTGCPVPNGIDEGEIAGFRYFKAHKVKAPCIKECPVNMEATVLFSKVFCATIKMYVCAVRAIHVDEYYDKLDKETKGHPGLMITNPIFEMYMENDAHFGNDADDDKTNFRMNVAAMSADTPLYQEPANIGPKKTWLGTFEIWMRDECDLQNITQSEYDEIMLLYASWKTDKNPKTNGDTKKALTAWLKEIVWSRSK